MKLNIVYKKEKEWFIGHIHMKNIILCLLFITVASVSNYSLAQQQLPSGNELLEATMVGLELLHWVCSVNIQLKSLCQKSKQKRMNTLKLLGIKT